MDEEFHGYCVRVLLKSMRLLSMVASTEKVTAPTAPMLTPEKMTSLRSRVAPNASDWSAMVEKLSPTPERDILPEPSDWSVKSKEVNCTFFALWWKESRRRAAGPRAG